MQYSPQRQLIDAVMEHVERVEDLRSTGHDDQHGRLFFKVEDIAALMVADYLPQLEMAVNIVRSIAFVNDVHITPEQAAFLDMTTARLEEFAQRPEYFGMSPEDVSKIEVFASGVRRHLDQVRQATASK